VKFDLIIRNAQIIDGSGAPGYSADLAISGGNIAAIGDLSAVEATEVRNAQGLVLAPGFIDVHTHDDLQVIHAPQMLPKISQGITTVIVGNCGISASPVTLVGDLPDPMNLLGAPEDFSYADFASYKNAVNQAQPAVNVAALIGHTALRNNHMDRLDRVANDDEIELMRVQLRESLSEGALGLSSGLAYGSAIASSTEEVKKISGSIK
jgi:N-acyl-D-amino-acid deacylase